MIKIFVHSHSEFIDISACERLGLGDHGDTAVLPSVDKYISSLASRFKGRILSQEDHVALQRMSQLANETNEQLKVYDVSRLRDKIVAAKYRIRKTPVVIINGEKDEDLEEILQAISK